MTTRKNPLTTLTHIHGCTDRNVLTHRTKPAPSNQTNVILFITGHEKRSMFGGGGGLNPRKMQQMMEQMGIEVDEIDTESVVIRLTDGTELVFSDPDVTKMEARGQETYQIVGEPETQETSTDEPADDEIPQEDIDLVMERTGADESAAHDALKAANGDLATAISQLE